MYLLDTDILSALLKPRQPAPLIRRLDAVPAQLQFTTSISVGEVYYGAFRLGTRGERWVREFDNRLLPNLTVVAFDVEAAEVYGRVRAELEAQGTPIGDADTRIAAVALVHSLILVTGNTRHFDRVPGLRIENWLA